MTRSKKELVSFKRFFNLTVAIFAVAVSATALVDVLRLRGIINDFSHTNETTMTELLSLSLQEPLVQGSFVEAQSRLKQFIDEGKIVCADLYDSRHTIVSCDDHFKKNDTLRSIERILYFDATKEAELARLRLYFDSSAGDSAIRKHIFGSFVVFALLTLVLLLLLSLTSHQISRDLSGVLRAPNPHEFYIREFYILAQQVAKNIVDLNESTKQAAIGHLASQVAHDIRSPLAALETVAALMRNLPDESAVLIRNSVERIREIANSLLDKERESLIKSGSAEPHFLLPLIESIVTEKRTQCSPKGQITIELLVDEYSNHAAVRIQPIEFKRVLSNLVGNAIEAIGEFGRVEICLQVKFGRVSVMVRDDGKGIDPTILPQLMTRGFSYGKANGTGLGLYYAKKSIQSWDGTIEIDSAPGRGTEVKVSFPSLIRSEHSAVK